MGINIELVQGLELKERLVSIPLPSTTMRHIAILKEEFLQKPLSIIFCFDKQLNLPYAVRIYVWSESFKFYFFPFAL